MSKFRTITTTTLIVSSSLLILFPFLRTLLLFFSPLLFSTSAACLLSLHFRKLALKEEPRSPSTYINKSRKISISVSEENGKSSNFLVGYKWEARIGKVVEKKLCLIHGINGVIMEEEPKKDRVVVIEDGDDEIDDLAEGLWDSYFGVFSRWHHRY